MAKNIIDHKDIDERSHPAARLFPMMSQAELSKLAEDIKKNGQLEPISLYGDLILDGRNRAAVCKMLGIAPMSVQVEPSSPVQYVMAKNLHRRHLTTGQRTRIAVEMVPMLEEEAKKRQGRRTDLIENKDTATSPPNGGEVMSAASVAAKAADVSPRTVERALRVRRQDPELYKKFESGEVSVHAAEREVSARAQEKEVPVARQKSLTAREAVRANAHKQRMFTVIGMVSGGCRGLAERSGTFDLDRAALACSQEELEWGMRDMKKAAHNLRLSIKKLEDILRTGAYAPEGVATPKEDILRANAKEVPVGGGVDMPGEPDMPDADDSLPARYRAKLAAVNEKIAARRKKGKEPTERMLESKASYEQIVAENHNLGF